MKAIEQQVMIRVRRIHFLRQFVNPTLLKVYGAAVLSGALASLVSLTNVYANMPSLLAPSAFTNFVMNALLHTEIFVQVLFAGIIIAFALLIRDLVRSVGKAGGTFLHA